MKEESDSGPGLRLQRKLSECNATGIQATDAKEHRVASEIHGLTLLTDLLDRIGRSSRFFLEVDRNVNGVWIRISRGESWGRKKEPLPGTITPRLQLRV